MKRSERLFYKAKCELAKAIALALLTIGCAGFGYTAFLSQSLWFFACLIGFAIFAVLAVATAYEGVRLVILSMDEEDYENQRSVRHVPTR